MTAVLTAEAPQEGNSSVVSKKVFKSSTYAVREFELASGSRLGLGHTQRGREGEGKGGGGDV